MSASINKEPETTESERFIPLWPADDSSVLSRGAEQPSIEAQRDVEQEKGDDFQIEPAHPSSPFSLPHTSCDVTYVPYESELQMPDVVKIMKASLSEPYSIYTYRYFIHNWPRLCVLAHCEGVCVGAIVCKLERHRYEVRRGYIAMLAVDQSYRKRKIGEKMCWKLYAHDNYNYNYN